MVKVEMFYTTLDVKTQHIIYNIYRKIKKIRWDKKGTSFPFLFSFLNYIVNIPSKKSMHRRLVTKRIDFFFLYLNTSPAKYNSLKNTFPIILWTFLFLKKGIKWRNARELTGIRPWHHPAAHAHPFTLVLCKSHCFHEKKQKNKTKQT